jgi:hypothetical protein
MSFLKLAQRRPHFSYVCTVESYNVSKIKNALVNSVYHIMEYIICRLVKSKILYSHSIVAEESSPVKCDTFSTDK